MDLPGAGQDGAGPRDLGAYELQNPAPVAAPDAALVNRGKSVTVAVLANDADAIGGLVAASVRLVGADAGSGGLTRTVAGAGLWTVNPATGAVTFAADPTFTGVTTAAYTVADAFGARSAETEIAVTVALGVALVGTNNAETLTGSAFDDTISGRNGNDALSGLGGDDLLR